MARGAFVDFRAAGGGRRDHCWHQPPGGRKRSRSAGEGGEALLAASPGSSNTSCLETKFVRPAGERKRGAPRHGSTGACRQMLSGTCQLRSPKRIGLLFLSPRTVIGSNPRLSRTAKHDRAERRTTMADASSDILSSVLTSSGVKSQKPSWF